MKSLKFKLTVIFTITIVVVILLFSNFTYLLTSNLFSTHLTNNDIREIVLQNPNLREFLATQEGINSISEVNKLVREYERNEIKNIIYQVTIPFIFGSALLAYLVSTYFLRPIEDLTIAISRINPKTLDKRIPEKQSSKEVEYLVQSFNKLLTSLEVAFSMREAFIQDVAHEIRTPLSAIKANIDVIKHKKNVTMEEYKDLIKTIEKLNEDLISMNESILFLDSLENKYEEYKSVNIQYLVEDILEGLGGKIIEKGVKVNLKSDKNANAFINPKEMTIALRNIIENSIKYSSEKSPKISINISLKNKQIEVLVKDNGIGISDKDLKNIFTRFYRGRNAISQSGSGLGLAIVKKIIEKHKGKIDISSQKDKGTTVTVSIPIKNKLKDIKLVHES